MAARSSSPDTISGKGMLLMPAEAPTSFTFAQLLP